MTLGNPTGRATLGARRVATITIVDNEPAVYFPAGAVAVGEAATAVTVVVARSGPATTAFTVPITAVGGTAVAGQDHPASLGVPGVVVTFPSGVTSKSVTIPLVNDRLIDGPKTLIVQLGAPSDPAVVAGTQQMLTISVSDNDTGGLIGFAVASSTVLESKAVKVVVTRTGVNLAGGVTVDYAVALGRVPPDATPGMDFTVSGSGVLTFAAGATTATIDVSALADTLEEPVESFALELSAPSSGATLAPGKTVHVVRISDTNQPGVIQWALAGVTTREGAPPIALTIKRTGLNLAQDVTVSYAIDAAPGTAVPADYAFTPGSVTFGAGETEKTVVLGAVDDGLVEPTETVRITLSGPTHGATLGAIKTVTVSIAPPPS